MSRKIPDRPVCMHCGKPLSRMIHSWHRNCSVGPPPDVGQPMRVNNGKSVIAIIGKRGSPPRETYRYWCGEWGKYGDGCFCNLRCGYLYGRTIGQAIQKFKEQPFTYHGYTYQVKTDPNLK